MHTHAQLRSEISDRHGSATGRGHDWSHGPAVRVCDAARLGESVQSGRWRSGLVRPPDPARGCVDWLAGPARGAGSAVRRNTPPGGLVGAVLHGREAGWSFPSGDDTSVRSRLIRCRALRPSPLKKVQVVRRIQLFVPHMRPSPLSNEEETRSGRSASGSDSSSYPVPPAVGRVNVKFAELAVLDSLGLMQAGEDVCSMFLSWCWEIR